MMRAHLIKQCYGEVFALNRKLFQVFSNLKKSAAVRVTEQLIRPIHEQLKLANLNFHCRRNIQWHEYAALI